MPLRLIRHRRGLAVRRPRLARTQKHHPISWRWGIVTAAGDMVGRVRLSSYGTGYLWSISCPYCLSSLGERHIEVIPDPILAKPDREAIILAAIEAKLRAKAHTSGPCNFWRFEIDSRGWVPAHGRHIAGSARDRRRAWRATIRAAARIAAAISYPPETTP